MPTIPVTDKLGLKIDVQFDDKGAASQFGLQALESKTSEFVGVATKPLDQTTFHSAVFGGNFKAPAIALSDALSLLIKSGASVTVGVYRNSDKTLFDTGGASPGVPIAKDEAWVSVALDTSLKVQAAVSSPSGFGVSGSALQLTCCKVYTLLKTANGSFPTLKEGLASALSNLRLVKGAGDLREQPANTVFEWDVSGTFTLEGSYGYPFAANAFRLAKVDLPLHHELNVSPAITLGVSGTLAVTGEFRGRCYRPNGSKIQIGLYKRKETDLSVTCQAGAGLSATSSGPNDLISAVFSVLPGANLDVAQIPDADRKAMQDALHSALDQGFTIGMNATCSAALTDEAAVLYEVDLGGDRAATDLAIDAALKGNWTLLKKLPAAKELRNVLTETHESGSGAALNLLGVYDFASAQDFVRECRILHNAEDGAITITDKETAQQIAIAAKPFLAQDKELRKVLDQAFLATVAYSAADAHAGLAVHFQATQSLLLYNISMGYPALRKTLLLGVALGLITAADLNEITAQRDFRYVRVTAKTAFDGDIALRLFFSDPAARTPYNEQDLKQLGRQTLASLMDRSSVADDARWLALTNDATWAQMEEQKFPTGSPASYSDWYDITFWAHSIATVATQLKTVLDAADSQPAGDPAKNQKFMTEREALAKAIAEVTRNTHAAFEKGWPLAVMFALSGRKAPISFDAQWDGKMRLSKQANRALTA